MGVFRDLCPHLEFLHNLTVGWEGSQITCLKNSLDICSVLKITQTHPFTVFLLTELCESCDHDELHDAGEDEHHAGQHPDVKVGDVGDLGDILSHGAEHCCQRQQGRHSFLTRRK